MLKTIQTSSQYFLVATDFSDPVLIKSKSKSMNRTFGDVEINELGGVEFDSGFLPLAIQNLIRNVFRLA